MIQHLGLITEYGFAYPKGYKLIKNNDDYYIFISSGCQRSDEAYLDIKKIRIKGKDIEVEFEKKNDSGGPPMADIKETHKAIKLNKEPENITVIEKDSYNKRLKGKKYEEIKYMNLTQSCQYYLNVGKKEQFDDFTINNLISRFFWTKEQVGTAVNAAIRYNGILYESVDDCIKLKREIYTSKSKKYRIEATTENGKDILTIMDIDK